MTPLLFVALAGAGEIAHDRPGDAMPDRHWDVVHLDLELKVDLDAQRVEGTTAHTVHPLGNRSQTLRLHQAALEISAIRVDGEDAPYWNTGEQWIDVPMPVAGEEHTVEVDFSATPQTGLHWRDPVKSADPIREVWSQGEDADNRYWFPSWDYPSDKFTVSTHLTVPDGLVALANGVQSGKEPAGGGWTRWSYELDRPIVNYLVAIAVGDYTVVAEQGAVPLEYIGASTHEPSTIRRGFDRAKPQMAYFAELLDEPYPWPVYRQVMVSRFMYGGMENASMTVMADGMLQPVEGGRTLRSEEVAAHELAHQWFGDLVTCYGWRELWLNEGFATFYTGRWMEHTRGEDYYATKVRGWHRGAARLTTPMSPRGWSAVDGRENEGVYVRGATVLHMLRVYLGDEVFDAGIRLYLDRNADRLVESDDLRRALEDVSGTHLGWFFDQWVHGTGVPAIDSSWSWADGQLTVVLKQTTEGTAFWAPVEVEIGTGEDTVVKQLWLGEGEARAVVDLEKRPAWVAVDPRGGLLANWTHHQEPAEWISQASQSPSAYARLIALEQLGEAPAAEGTALSLQTVLQDTSVDPAVRQVAARSLGKVAGEAEILTLEAAFDAARDSYLREAIVGALGETEANPDLLAWLGKIARTNEDPDVAGAAIQAMASLDEKRGLTLARLLVGKADRSWGQEVHQAALSVLGKGDGPLDMAVLLSKMAAKHGRGVRQRAAWSAAAVWEGLDEKKQEGASKRLESALIPWLRDPDIRVRQAGIGLLGRVGGDAAEGALRRFAGTNEVPGMSKQALDAASSIRTRQRGDDGQDAEQQKEDLERLQEELDKLMDRLDRLEEWR